MDLDNTKEKELISKAIGLISKKWHSRIIYVLLNNGEANFSQFREELGDISNKVLSESLNDLREKKLVEKSNGSDPKYVLTDKGKDLEGVFDAVSDWSEKYLAEQKPEVLIVEDNKPQSKMYKRWLEPAYETRTANTRSEIFDEISDSTEIVLLDRKLPSTSAEELLTSSDVFDGKQVIMITGIEPGIELIQLDITDYILKPISKEDLHDAVNKAVKAARGTENDRELVALVSKKRVLDRKPRGIRESGEYKELMERIENLKEDMDALPDPIEKELEN